jgi:Predicted integral membrane protein (DUF2269)
MHLDYTCFKFAHVLIAIIALGTSAALGILLEFFADHPTHGAFVLRTVRQLMYCVVIPGYLLMLATGMWMGHLAALLDARWTEAAMNLWGVGALFMALSLAVLQRQIKLFDSAGPSSPAYRRVAMLGRLSGGGAGLIIVVIVYFMIFKPS